MPIVIGRAASPRCFKGIADKSKPLGIPYYSNAKAWMDSAIMSDILSKLNRKFVHQNRKVLLFLDNVSSHSPDLVGRFSNITVIFLPKNTTSRLQPLDAGIIKNFKVCYRKLIVKHALAKIKDTPHTASEITKSIDVLMAIRWIKHAWDSVRSNTITNCFKHCGFFCGSADISDPFADLDDQDEFDADLEDQVSQFDGDMSANSYVNCDDDLATCTTFEDASNWREELRDMIISRATKKSKEMASEDEEE